MLSVVCTSKEMGAWPLAALWTINKVPGMEWRVPAPK
jgi:hypothetical protein